MGMRAVLSFDDGSGSPCRFWSSWASPEFQIPYLADLVHHLDQAGLPLTADTYRQHVAANPGQLPERDITEHGTHITVEAAGDLDFRYHLHAIDGCIAFEVLHRNRDAGRPFTVELAVTGRAELYRAAIEHALLLTERAARPNGGPADDTAAFGDHWSGRAETYRTWLADTPDDGENIDAVLTAADAVVVRRTMRLYWPGLAADLRTRGGQLEVDLPGVWALNSVAISIANQATRSLGRYCRTTFTPTDDGARVQISDGTRRFRAPIPVR